MRKHVRARLPRKLEWFINRRRCKGANELKKFIELVDCSVRIGKLIAFVLFC